MVCYYLRHIDLHAVYEQLPNYGLGVGYGPSLANIPEPLCETLSLYFELIAEVAAETCEQFPYWRQWNSADLAAEVGDLIEIEIEHLGRATSCWAPMAEEILAHGETLESFLFYACSARSSVESETTASVESETNYLPLLCLLIYEYDALCSLYASGHMEAALEVFESIAEARETLTHSQWLTNRVRMRSREASTAAKARHRETNAHRADAIEQWNAGGHQFSSMRAFARNRFKDFGVTDYMTVYNWLRKARREGEDDHA